MRNEMEYGPVPQEMEEWYDTLTGLLNRRTFLRLLEGQLQDHPGTFIGIALVEPANWAALFRAGSQLKERMVQQFAFRLADLGEDEALLSARVGNDTFAICYQAAGFSEWRQFLAKLQDTLGDSLLLPERHTKMPLWLGTSVYPLESGNADGLLRHAQLALWQERLK